MKNSWEKELIREYSEKKLDIPCMRKEKKTMKFGRKTVLVSVCIILAAALATGVAAVGIATNWFNSPLIKNNSLKLSEVPEGYTGIYSAEDLNKIRNGDSKANYILMNDIDLSGAEWTPITLSESAQSTLYAGVFNGNGYVIKNFTVNSGEAYAGFFAETAGTFINLGIENCTINVNCTSAPVAKGYLNSDEAGYGGIAGVAAFVGSCYAENVKLNINFSAAERKFVNIGGLAGSTTYVDSCHADAYITFDVAEGTQCATGKIAGTAMSMLTSFAVGNGDGVQKLANVSAGNDVPTVLEKEVFEKLCEKIDAAYPENDVNPKMFRAYYKLLDMSLAESGTDIEKLENALRTYNSYRNFYGDGDALRSVYVLATDSAVLERSRLAEILLTAFGGEDALSSFWTENGVRAGEINSYYFADSSVFDTSAIQGFDTEKIWSIEDGKATLRIFG